MPSPAVIYDFKSPKISSFEFADGRSFYCAFTLNKKRFGSVRQCKLMHQLLYSILHKIGICNKDIISSIHSPLTKKELKELPLIDGISSQAWLYLKGKWRLKILEQRILKLKEEEENAKAKGTVYKQDDTKIDPVFLHHLWSQIVDLVKTLCSAAHIRIVDDRTDHAEQAKSKRKAYNDAIKNFGTKQLSLEKSRKTMTVKQQKVYRPKGVTTITSDDLKYNKLKNIGDRSALKNSRSFVPMGEEGGTETIRNEYKMKNWIDRGGMIGRYFGCLPFTFLFFFSVFFPSFPFLSSCHFLFIYSHIRDTNWPKPIS
jgi:hypothetical protein